MVKDGIKADDVANAEAISVFSCSINCPHCNASQDGWLADPRDREHECDDCGKTYRVPADVRITF